MCPASLLRPAFANAETIDALRLQIARIGGSSAHVPGRPPLPFEIPSIDAALPGGGIGRGALHEVAGAGLDTSHAAVPAMFVAGLVTQLAGAVLWVVDRDAPFCPGLVTAGLDPDRLIVAEARKDVLLVMEEGLRHGALAAVVGELSGRLGLTASRRLQLAADTSGVTAFVVRRSRRHDDPALSEPNASLTRWRVAAAPSPPTTVRTSRKVSEIGRGRWKLDLLRARGGDTRSWLVEALDQTGRLQLAVSVDLPAQSRPTLGRGRQAA